MKIPLARLYAAFGVDGTEAVRRLARRAESDCGLGVTVISAAAHEGAPLGAASAELVARHRRRTGTYLDLLRAIRRSVPGIRVLKGPALARLYPDGWVRPAGDLDLVAEDEPALWAAAATVVSSCGATLTMLTRFRSAAADRFVLGLEWPSPDPLMESDLEVELSMTAYVGDGAALPPRHRCPEPDALAQLLAVAEEAVQRRPSVKDALDVAVLLPSFLDMDPADAVETLAAYRLAPEVGALLRASAAGFPAAFADRRAEPAVAAVEDLAAHERRRRPAGPRSDADISGWPGDITFGAPLPGAGRDHPAVTGARSYVSAACEVLCTPVGDFLMVGGRDVDGPAWDAAVGALPALHAVGQRR